MSGSPLARLVDAYDLVVLDLDGVVYLADRPIPGAAEAITELHRSGPRVAYATNNASRRATEVAALLASHGVPASPVEVLTSARAAAAVLAEHLAPGARVLVVGAEALWAEVREAGLVPAAQADPSPAAVVQGYGPNVGWAELAEACVAIRAGALWVATNTDRTLPTPRGPLPGNGALVAALRTALDRGPDIVVGKPKPGLFTTAVHQAGADRPLVVGDRLDTDIEGATGAGMDSMLVLTGVSRPADLLAAPPQWRPTYVAADLGGLFDVDGAVRVPPQERHRDGVVARGWRATRRGPALELTGSGVPLDALRALCGAAWASDGPFEVVTGSDEAEQALGALGLAP